MTGTPPELAGVLSATSSVLLDFDGPVSPIFANGVNAAVAEQMRAALIREGARPDLMKPHPQPVHRALAILNDSPERCVLVGDSLTDIEVAHKTGVRSIGYAKAPERIPGLTEAGADVVIDDMRLLATAFRDVPPVATSAV